MTKSSGAAPSMGDAAITVKGNSKDPGEMPESWGYFIGAFQVAIWTLGIAYIAWMEWWWPGIMVLVALSALVPIILAAVAFNRGASQQAVEEARVLHTVRAEALPRQCSACGAPLSAASVIWRTPTTASCPYCDTVAKGKE